KNFFFSVTKELQMNNDSYSDSFESDTNLDEKKLNEEDIEISEFFQKENIVEEAIDSDVSMDQTSGNTSPLPETKERHCSHPSPPFLDSLFEEKEEKDDNQVIEKSVIKNNENLEITSNEESLGEKVISELNDEEEAELMKLKETYMKEINESEINEDEIIK